MIHDWLNTLWRWLVGTPEITLTISISPEARKFFRDPDFIVTGRRTVPYPDAEEG